MVRTMDDQRHPIRLVVSGELERPRLTVFFRLLLAFPHFIWWGLWTFIAYLAAFVNWFPTLGNARSPQKLHSFLAAYVRYTVHLWAFVLLAADPFPGFTGEPGYPVDVEIAPPAEQDRVKTGFRWLLFLPASIISSALAPGPSLSVSASTGGSSSGSTGGIALISGILAWFSCMARGRMPQGLHRAIVFGLSYMAQSTGYVMLLTDVYPDSDPGHVALPADPPPPPMPLRLALTDDGARGRWTVLFRFILVIPHLIWLTLWGIVAFLAGIVNGILVLIRGEAPDGMHRFLAAFVRYGVHVAAYWNILAQPFPRFDGRAGVQPVDLEVDPPAVQGRWSVFFRWVLILPAVMVAGAMSTLLFALGFLNWWVGLFTGAVPERMRRLAHWTLQYQAHLYAYGLILTDRFPYTGPEAVPGGGVPAPMTAPDPEPLVA
jgi:hypothetical protein